MGKIRNKPTYYTTDSNTIGDVTDIGNNQLDFHNISLNEVYDKLGEATKSVQTIVNSSNINHWAAFRPYPETVSFISDTLYKNGWRYYENTGNLVKFSGWNETEKRLGDFAGYNHTSQPSKLLHDPNNGFIGQNISYIKGDQPTHFKIRFHFGEISPVDYCFTKDNPVNRMHLTFSGNERVVNLSNIDVNNNLTLDTANYLGGSGIPQDYGSQSYRVFFKVFGETPEFNWKYGTEIINEFTITVKSFYTYDYTYNSFGFQFFTLNLTQDEYYVYSPTQGVFINISNSTFDINSSIFFTINNFVMIEVSKDGINWVFERNITTNISSITINWSSVFGEANVHTEEDDTYYIRATYFEDEGGPV